MDMEFDWKLQRMTTDAMMDIMIANENPRLSAAKCDALMEIKRRCCKYREIGFVSDLVLAVLEKKLELLKKADTIKDCKKIQAPSAPIYHQYSGDFRTDDPWVAEEELIQWTVRIKNISGIW
jgi:hypothetical protein